MSEVRHDWTTRQVEAVIQQPFHDLLAAAQACHRERFDPHRIEGAKLLSIKTGACPEDCAYCPQSAHHNTEVAPSPLMDTEEVLVAAKQARAEGATRFCMGAAWRAPSDKQVAAVADSVRAVKNLGLQTCVTLGMLTEQQALSLSEAGLDYYNHNLDTAPDFYGEIITTRTYQDRLETLRACRDAGLRLCAGGIVGMGESRTQRAGLLAQLACLDPHPESVPINLLIRVPGTPLEDLPDFEPLELVRTIAAARLVMPASTIRLSAGRSSMSEELHALCLHAGAGSIFLGERLLTADNPGDDADHAILIQLDTTLHETQPAPRQDQIRSK